MNAKDAAWLELEKVWDDFEWRDADADRIALRRAVAEKIHAYAVAAVAEARAPLVEILQNAVSCPSCWIIKGQPHDPDCPVAAALAAKETP